jgi:hypothetical protein
MSEKHSFVVENILVVRPEFWTRSRVDNIIGGLNMVRSGVLGKDQGKTDVAEQAVRDTKPCILWITMLGIPVNRYVLVIRIYLGLHPANDIKYFWSRDPQRQFIHKPSR